VNEVAKLERRDVIAIVTVNSPPVNALSVAVRGGIFESIKSAIADPEVKAIVLTCGGRTFIAGADITEFGKPTKPPGLHEVLTVMENSPKPIVAAIHGTALGGGLEVALACHFRVATKDARLGLPEVKLGLLPGAGGTQRLPRAVGPELAVKMIVGGDPISASEALKNGLIEEIVEGPAAGGEAFARKVLAEKRPLRKLRDDDSKLAAAKADRSIFTSAVAALTKKARGLEAPFAAADAVGAAIDLPFDEGLKKEREGFLKLVSSDQSKAQRYAFFSEREAAKITGVPEGTKPRNVERVAIIGAGTMGGGIAMSFANAGIPVTLIETGEEQLKRGMGVMQKNYEATAARGGIPADQRRGRHRERWGCRPRDRGGVRDHGDQEGSVREARQVCKTGRGAGFQHLLSQHRRDREVDKTSAGRAGHALLLTGQCDEAVRDRACGKDRAGRTGDRGGGGTQNCKSAGGGRRL
jgi:3-hydroxyacyl-CoA dehydrogenase